jgi:tRNA nucleotidyltransferase (CCA-adding enzyme)
MRKNSSLSRLIEKNLPTGLLHVLKQTAEISVRRDLELYMVGGVVRDLLLGLPNIDLDLVVEGDATSLARELAEKAGGKLTVHTRFGTAKLKLEGWSLDMATARAEEYTRPGALPAVRPGTLADDLFRRDFTINAMAICLSPTRYGELIDLYGGRKDLENKLIRVLHDRSFIDDATRIWRTARYEQRLGFRIEPHTLSLLKGSLSYLDSVSGDRIRHELEMVLKEREPEKMLHRAWILNVLGKIHPSLKGDAWLTDKFRQARAMGSGQTLIGMYWALLTYRMSETEIEEVTRRLRPSRQVSVILRDTNQLKSNLKGLTMPGRLSPARIYSLVHGYAYPALLANLTAANSAKARGAVSLYLEKLRFIKPALNGKDLQTMGITPGPRMQEILIALYNARLNGEITSRAQEEALVRKYSAVSNS